MNTSAKPHSLVTNGRKNLNLAFHIQFTGQQIYDLLEVLERQALEDECYLRVRQAVAFAEMIREQAQKQPF